MADPKPLAEDQKKKNKMAAGAAALALAYLAFTADKSEAASGTQFLDRTYTVVKAGSE